MLLELELSLQKSKTSDITYRLYDFDRVDAQGNKRELHIDLALDAINYNVVEAQKDYSRVKNSSNEMVNCPYFTTNFIPLDEKIEVEKDKKSFTVYMCVEGNFELEYKGESYNYKTGDSVLIPAEMASFEINGNASLLEIYIS